MFKVNNKKTRTTSPFPSVPIVDFELVNVSWAVIKSMIYVFPSNAMAKLLKWLCEGLCK